MYVDLPFLKKEQIESKRNREKVINFNNKKMTMTKIKDLVTFDIVDDKKVVELIGIVKCKHACKVLHRKLG